MTDENSSHSFGPAERRSVRLRDADFSAGPNSSQNHSSGSGDDEEAGWPAWQTTLFVLAVCGGFWAAVVWMFAQLFG